MVPFDSSPPHPRAASGASAALEQAAALGTALRLDELLSSAATQLKELFEAELFRLFVVDRERSELRTYLPGSDGPNEHRIWLASGILGQVAQTGIHANLADATLDPRFAPETDAMGEKIQALVAQPVRSKDGSIIGVAMAANRAGGFTTQDEALLALLTPLLGQHLENARLYEALQQQNEALRHGQDQLRRKVAEVDLLFAIEREVSAAGTLEDLLNAVLFQARNTFASETVAVLLTDDDSNELFLIAAQEDAVQTRLLPARPNGSPCEAALKSAEPVLVTAEGAGSLESLAGGNRRAVLCARLVAQESRGPGRVLGLIEWTNPLGAFTEEDRALASVVAAQVGRAVSLCRARVESERTSRLAMLGQMLGGLVHDMRSPMTVIGGYAELLSRENDSGVRERYSNQIFTQLEQVNAMTRDVLSFIRGERQVLARRVALATFWQDMLPVLTRELEPNRVELKLHLEYIGAARLDEGKFRRVITNLARNAAQAMQGGGTFSVACTAEGDALRLRFSDNGPGMPPHVAAKLFTAFNSHGKRGGTGLGLALVKEIVDGHGGQVSCTTVEQQGTTFDIRLPHAVVP